MGPGEICDDGVNDGSYGGCSRSCDARGPRCGDGSLQGDEACDDGNEKNADGCNTDCVESGSVLWTRTFDEPARALDVDDADGVLVAGDVGVGSGPAWITHFDAMGSSTWETEYAYPDSGNTDARGVSFHRTAGWLIAGSTSSTAEGTNAWWQGYTDGADPSLAGSYGNPSGSTDNLGGIAFDDAGSFYVAVNSVRDDLGHGSDIILRKMDARGDELWTQVFDGGDDDYASSIAVGNDDGAALAGYTVDAGGDRDVWLRKYGSEGSVSWTRTHSDDGGEGQDLAFDVALGPDSSVVAVGASANDIWIRKYTHDGMEVWTVTHDGVGQGECFFKCRYDRATGVAIDSTGAVVVAAREAIDGSTSGTWITKYDDEGTVLWTNDSSPDGSAYDTEPTRVAVGSDDSITVIGVSSFNDSDGGWARRLAP